MRLLLEFARAHPWHSLLMLLCLVIAAGAEAVAFTSLLPLISVLDGSEPGEPGSVGAPAELEGWFTGALQSIGLEPTLNLLLVLVPLAFAVRATLVLLARREIGYTVARVARDLRLRLIRALLGSNWSYFVAQRVGTFANAYAVETTRATKGYMNATWVAMLSLQLVVYVAIAIAISWKVTLAAALIGVFVMTVLGPIVKVGRRAGVKQTILSKQVVGTLTDIFQGVKPLKAMAREHRVSPLLEDGTRRLEKAMRKQVLSREAIAALQEPIATGMLCLGIFGMSQLGFNLASMSVMALTISRTLDTLNRAQRRYVRVAVQESAYWSLMETIEEAELACERPTEGAPVALETAVSLQSIGFRYADEVLFEDLTLEIPAGEITALVGPSGSGKTTIVDLVVGLAQPDEGKVLVDGTPLADVDLAAWRQRIGYVPQEMFLLHDTVAMNVALGDPDVTEADIIRALKDARAWNFVSRMPEGIGTIVGERGSALSGGQRQRIAIARALLHEPLLLVLDEATAALDSASEAEVWETVADFRGRMAVLAISHQPALLGVADRVYHIENGRAKAIAVGESGSVAIGTGPRAGA